MRPVDSAYDRSFAAGTISLLDALRATGHVVETPVTGSVIVDGDEITSDAWDSLVASWDGSEDGLADLGWEV